MRTTRRQQARKKEQPQRESIERYGKTDDVDKTLQEIKQEDTFDSFNMTE